MTFGPEYPQACVSTLTTPLQVQALLTSTPLSGAQPSIIYDYEIIISETITSTISSTTTISTGLAIADPVVVAWQTKDYSVFPSDYASSLAERFAIAFPTSGNSSGTGLQPSSPPKSGLGTGTKAGIGVGAVCAFAILIGIALLFFRKRRSATTTSDQSQHPTAEMDDQDDDLATRKWWMGGKWRSEAPVQRDPEELDDRTVYVVPGPPAELDGVGLQYPTDNECAVLHHERDTSQVHSSSCRS